MDLTCLWFDMEEPPLEEDFAPASTRSVCSRVDRSESDPEELLEELEELEELDELESAERLRERLRGEAERFLGEAERRGRRGEQRRGDAVRW